MNQILIEDCERIISQVNLSPLFGKKILFTGSNGLFGRYFTYLVYLLNKEKKAKITLYCVSLHGANKNIKELARLDSSIIPLKKDLSKAFTFSRPVNYIFHAACYGQPKKFIDSPKETIDLNVSATWRLLEIAKKNKARFLFFSSAEVYGDIPKDKIPVSESYAGNSDTTGVRAIYGESKRLGETVCSIFRRDYNLPVYIARISHTYGPGVSHNDTRVLGDILKKAQSKKRIELLDDGSAVKTFGYIGDLIPMLLTITLYGKDLIYNVGGIDTVSIKELATQVGNYFDVPVYIPKKVRKVKHIGNDPLLVKLNFKKYQKEFGKVRFTPFSIGIQRMLQWNEIEFTH